MIWKKKKKKQKKKKQKKQQQQYMWNMSYIWTEFAIGQVCCGPSLLLVELTRYPCETSLYGVPQGPK